MIRGNASAKESAEHVFFAGRSNRRGTRWHGPCGLKRSEPRKFVGSGCHLGTQPVENGERSFLRAGGEIAGGADAGGATLFARTRGDEFARFLHQELVRSKERFRKANAPRVGVVQVQVRFEEFLGVAGDCILHSGRSDIFYRAIGGIGASSRRTFANRSSKVAAVAHEQKSGDGF